MQRCCCRCEWDYHAGNIHTIMCRSVVVGVGVISMQVIFTPLCRGIAAGMGEITMQVIFTPLCAGVLWHVWVWLPCRFIFTPLCAGVLWHVWVWLPCRLYSHHYVQVCCSRCGWDYHAGSIHTIMRRCVVACVSVITMQVIFTPLCAGALWQVWVRLACRLYSPRYAEVCCGRCGWD